MLQMLELCCSALALQLQPHQVDSAAAKGATAMLVNGSCSIMRSISSSWVAAPPCSTTAHCDSSSSNVSCSPAAASEMNLSTTGQCAPAAAALWHLYEKAKRAGADETRRQLQGLGAATAAHAISATANETGISAPAGSTNSDPAPHGSTVNSHEAADVYAGIAKLSAEGAAAATVASSYLGSVSCPLLGFSRSAWSQVVSSLHMDLVKIKGEHKELLGRWAGDPGEELSFELEAVLGLSGFLSAATDSCLGFGCLRFAVVVSIARPTRALAPKDVCLAACYQATETFAYAYTLKVAGFV